MDCLTFAFKATCCNGWPKIKIFRDHTVIKNHQFSNEKETISIEIPNSRGNHLICVERFGKEDHNVVVSDGFIIEDQVVEIESIFINGVKLPDFVINNHTEFKFADQVHKGSTYFGPNGTWSLKYYGSMVTWLLDRKITHEVQYNQDYQFPWAYKLGPDSVSKTVDEIDSLLEKIQNFKFND